MTEERSKQVKALFEAALERPPEERAAFLATATRDDRALLREVESLLASDPQASSSVEPAKLSGRATVGFEHTMLRRTLIGRTLGHYQIEAELGTGGMGTVYRAHDTRLQRPVAVKLLAERGTLDSAARDQLLREARNASALNHPHICTIYEVGEAEGHSYIAMEFVDGQLLETLIPHGGLPVESIVKYGAQIADALAQAHERGIVHRDVKGSNVVITRNGQAKVLDFGIARRVRQEELEEATRGRSLSEAGLVVGTLPYMPPEVLRGQGADARSDIWSLGVLLYKMTTGELPFEGSTGFELTSAILRDPPKHVQTDVPQGLAALIQRCLAKESGQRYQRASEVRAALETLQSGLALGSSEARTKTKPTLAQRDGNARAARRALGATGAVAALLALAVALNVRGWRDRVLGRSTADGVRSLAVLPLQDFSGDARQEYLTDGMTEALIADLSQIGALRVVSRTSVMQYKQARKALPEIARALNVELVVEGSVVREGDRVRVTAQLIDAATDRHLWAKSYERELSNLVALQRDIARAIAQEIRVTVTPQEQARLANVRPVNPEAQEAHLMGRYLWNKRTEAGFKQALELFQQSLDKDAAYAPAHAGMAATYNLLQFYAGFSPHTVFPRARAAARRALELDETLGEAHATLAYVSAYYDWNWVSAEREFQRALELNPNDAETYQSYSRFLAARGRVDEALVKMKQAQERNPVPLILKANEAIILYFARRYDQAIEQLRKTLELDPNFAVAHWGLGLAHEQRGAYSEAVAEFQKALATLSSNAMMKASLGHTYAVMGDRTKAERVLEELSELAKRSYVPSYYAATIYAGLGDKERALEWLEKAYEEHSTLLSYLKMDPRLDPLRSDPRFSDLLGRVGLASP